MVIQLSDFLSLQLYQQCSQLSEITIEKNDLRFVSLLHVMLNLWGGIWQLFMEQFQPCINSVTFIDTFFLRRPSTVQFSSVALITFIF